MPRHLLITRSKILRGTQAEAERGHPKAEPGGQWASVTVSYMPLRCNPPISQHWKNSVLCPSLQPQISSLVSFALLCLRVQAFCLLSSGEHVVFWDYQVGSLV